KLSCFARSAEKTCYALNDSGIREVRGDASAPGYARPDGKTVLPMRLAVFLPRRKGFRRTTWPTALCVSLASEKLPDFLAAAFGVSKMSAISRSESSCQLT